MDGDAYESKEPTPMTFVEKPEGRGAFPPTAQDPPLKIPARTLV